MNIAQVYEAEGAPVLVIYAHKLGTHQHQDIEGFTCLETGVSTCIRFSGENMPEKGIDSERWVAEKVKELFGFAIHWQSWRGGRCIHIIRLHRHSKINTSKSDPEESAA